MHTRQIIILIGLITTFIIGGNAHGSGLLAPTDQSLPPLRITNHLVDVAIRSNIARTKLTQTFRNDTNQRLEATYIFPLPENADLTDFQMSFNGKMVQGEVLPADKARQIYESIVRQARDPGLIEFIGRRLLRMRVFPIEPNSDTTISVQYQQVCRPLSGMMGYHYPLRTPNTRGQAYGTVRFAVTLETPTPLKSVWSPSHSVEIVRNGEYKATIAYEGAGGSLEDDFVLLYDTDGGDLGLSLVAHKPMNDQPGHFVLMLTPKQLWSDQDVQPQDVVFVLDTSGSMAGEKINQARESLRFCIDQLDDRDRFSIVRFSSGFDVLFDSVTEATPENKTKAKEWVSGFQASGGTNIADTLQHVLGMRPTHGPAPLGLKKSQRPFIVVFLTDGQGNRPPEEILSALGATGLKASLRIFPFGVGHDVNTVLLDGLANDFTGRPTYVQPGENLELVLGDFFSVISRPVLTNLKLSLPGVGATEQFPAVLGDLYHGQQLILAGRYADATTGPVTLTATRNGKRVTYTWDDTSFANTAEATYVPSVWAGRKIAYLIDEIRAHGENTEMIAEIIALSQEHGIQTPYSSWLVNPEQMVAFHNAPNLDLSGAMRQRGVRGGGGMGGGGLFGSPEDLSAPASRAIRDAGISLGQAVAIDDLEALSSFGDLDLKMAGEAMKEEAGKAATLLAKKTAEMKSMRSRDEGRLKQSALAVQKIGKTWFHRLGAYLVDERFTDKATIIVVKFGSTAYFDLIAERPDLRPILARQTRMLLMANEATAILISERTGSEEFSSEQREQLGLSAR